METPDKHGVYASEQTIKLARIGRTYATLELSQCLDGLYRFGLTLHYSHGGFASPIMGCGTGYATAALASQEGTLAMLGQLPTPWASDPQHVHGELAELRRRIEQGLRQPSLF